jgi:hypothetical protein
MLLKKKFKRLSKFLFISSLSLLMVIPLNAQKKSVRDAKIMVSKTGMEYEVSGWDSRIIYNPLSYSYMLWETPIYSTVKTKEVYPVAVSEFDKPPVFTDECSSAEDPMACSNNKLQEFVSSKEFKYPANAKRNNQEGLEYVTFTLNEKGQFEGRPTVLSKEDPCRGCEEKAIEIIKETEDQWQPAVLNGEPVKVILTIPVRFDLREIDFK